MRGSVLGMLVLAATATAGETGWREIQAPHVKLRTDLGSGDAREAALTVERYRAEIIAAAWPRASFPPGDVIEMTVLANGVDFERYFGRTIAGSFFHDVPPHAIMYGSPDRWEKRATLRLSETNSILKHELTHHLAAMVFKRQPKWFAEGLAQFLETVRPSDDGKSVIVGAANLEARTNYLRIRSLRVADALRWAGPLDTHDEMTIHGYYGLSWMMVHWLFNEHPDQFTQLQVLLSKGVDSEKAWKVIQPGLGTSDVDAAIQAYAQHGNYQEFQAPFTPPTATGFTEKPLSEADVHATRARVALNASRSTNEGKALRAAAGATGAGEEAGGRPPGRRTRVVDPLGQSPALRRAGTRGGRPEGLPAPPGESPGPEQLRLDAAPAGEGQRGARAGGQGSDAGRIRRIDPRHPGRGAGGAGPMLGGARHAGAGGGCAPGAS